MAHEFSMASDTVYLLVFYMSIDDITGAEENICSSGHNSAWLFTFLNLGFSRLVNDQFMNNIYFFK